MPEKDKDFKVQVSIESYDWKTGVPKEKKGEYCRWSDRSEVLQYKLPKNVFSAYTTPEDELKELRSEYKLFVYLLNEKDTPICFWSGSLSNFRNLDGQWQWIQLKPDRTYDLVKEDHFAGLVSIKVSVARLAQSGGGSIPFQKYPAWAKKPPRRVGAFVLRCMIFQCRDLPAADSDGSSDPFVKIFNTNGDDVVTSVIEDNTNPIFMECKDIGIDFLDDKKFTDAPPVVLDVLDSDEGMISTTADFLGRAIIYLRDIEGLVGGEPD